MGIARVMLTAEWALFIAAWLVCALFYGSHGKDSRKKHAKGRLSHPSAAFLLTAFLGYFLGEHLLKKIGLPGHLEGVVKTSGIVFAGGGLFFAIWARITLASNWSGSPSVIEGQTITKKGPYALVRHPIYAGVIAMLWGSFLAEGFFFLCLTALAGTVLLCFKARLEEALLSEYLGDEYRAFMKTTPMLLPSLFRHRKNLIQ